MGTEAEAEAPVRLLGPEDGELLGPPDGVMDRYMISAADTDGRFSLVEHRLAPHALAAPLHLHTREDEYSFVLQGEVGALLGKQEVVATAGDLLFKPRGQWHTFWNAGAAPARILEMISPAGLELLFRMIDTDPQLLDPDRLAEVGETFGCKVDFEGTVPVVERHGLVF